MHVHVTTAGQTSSISAADQFTYLAAVIPTVASLSPATGIAGTSVNVNGTGFTAASTVMFGNTAASSVIFVNSTQLTATVLSGTGTVDVQVTTAGQTSSKSANDQFTYATAPTVTSISPTSGPIGTTVTINGTGFTTLDGQLRRHARDFRQLRQRHATHGRRTTGTGNVFRVANAGLKSAMAIQFTIMAPTVTQINPTSGPTTGGTIVVITGTGFTRTSTVMFGTTAATKVTYVSTTSLNVTSPAGTGTQDVTVTTAGLTSSTSAADQFTFVAGPTVTSIAQTTGPTGTTVTVTGTGFNAGSTATFGGVTATNVSLVAGSRGTQLTLTAPPSKGTVDVQVTTNGQNSATLPADQFTYTAPTVVGITPTGGSSGTSVTISGTGFDSTSTVNFGSTPATNITFNARKNQLAATSPAGSGTVHVTVTTGGLTCNSWSTPTSSLIRPGRP